MTIPLKKWKIIADEPIGLFSPQYEELKKHKHANKYLDFINFKRLVFSVI